MHAIVPQSHVSVFDTGLGNDPVCHSKSIEGLYSVVSVVVLTGARSIVDWRGHDVSLLWSPRPAPFRGPCHQARA